MQMVSNVDKTMDWFLSNSPSPEIHIFLPPEVMSSISALPEQIIEFVLQHLGENYPLFDCSCTFTTENALRIVINNAHIIGAKTEEHNGIIDFPEMREEIRSEVINLLRDIKSNASLINNIQLSNEDKERIRMMRIASDERLDVEERIVQLNEYSQAIFKDGEVFSLNANGKVMDHIYIYTSRWDPIIKFNLQATNTFIMNATRIIFDSKEAGFEIGCKFINPSNVMKDSYGFAVQQNLDDSYFLNNSELRNSIIEAANKLRELNPQEFLVGNPDAVILNVFKDGFAVGTFLKSQSIIDHEKYGITPNYF